MKKHYFVTANIAVMRDGFEDKLYNLSFNAPVELIPENLKPTTREDRMKMMTIRHLIHVLMFDRQEDLDVALALSLGESAGCRVQFVDLTYTTATEYRQWLPLEVPADIENRDLMTDNEFQYEATVQNVAKTMVGMEVINSHALAVLDALIETYKGPLQDGDIPSKSGRDQLIELGLAVRVIHDRADGCTSATYFGRDVYKYIHGKSATLEEAITHHNAAKWVKTC